MVTVLVRGYAGQFGEHHIQRALARVWSDMGIRLRAYNVSIGGRCIGATSGCTGSPITLTSEFATKGTYNHCYNLVPTVSVFYI